MIKFFRKIRYNLLSKNKTSKYFKYAIGEIILVVIGILIALSINNWNENNKLQKEEQKLLSALVKEIESNIENLEPMIVINDTILRRSNKFLKKYSNNMSLDFNPLYIPSLFGYESNNIERSILNEILGTDSRSLISEEKYIEQLRILKRSYNDCEKTQKFVDEYWNGQVIDFFNSSGLGIYLGNIEVSKNQIIEFEINKNFLSVLSMMNSFQLYLLNSRMDLMKTLNETLEVLTTIEKT